MYYSNSDISCGDRNVVLKLPDRSAYLYTLEKFYNDH